MFTAVREQFQILQILRIVTTLVVAFLLALPFLLVGVARSLVGGAQFAQQEFGTGPLPKHRKKIPRAVVTSRCRQSASLQFQPNEISQRSSV